MKIYGHIEVGEIYEMSHDGGSRLALVVEKSHWNIFEVLVEGKRQQVHRNLLRDLPFLDFADHQDEK